MGTCSPRRTSVGDRVRATSTAACKAAWRLYDLASAGIGDAVHPAPILNLPMYIDPLSALGPSGGPDLPQYIANARTALNADASVNKNYHLEIGNNGYEQYTLNYRACNPLPLPSTSSSEYKSMLDIYKFLVAAPRTHNAANFSSIIISSGDIDPVVSLHGTEAAADAIGFTIRPGYERRPWFYRADSTSVDVIKIKPRAWGQSLAVDDGGVQIGGFTKRYETRESVNIDFVSVRNSGHMVPGYAPQRAMRILHSLFDHHDAALAPPLEKGWDHGDDTEWYGTANTTGVFASWITKSIASI